MTEDRGGDRPESPRIGFVGLGNMGGPMCRRLVAAGYAVVAHDISSGTTTRRSPSISA